MRRLSLLHVTALLVAGPLTAQDGPAPTPESVARAIDSLALVQQAEGRVAGLSVGVMYEGQVVLARGFGVANLATGEPVTDSTRFAIGSVTKQFATVCALLLVEEGRLSLDDPVAKWYPDLTRAADIRIRDLVAHVSSYPDYYPLDFVDRRMAVAAQTGAIIRRYATGPLDFEPGSRWSYSNTGYLVLGGIIERVSGMPLGRFLERRIFRPLGMRHTRYQPDPNGPGVARGYRFWALGPLEPATPEAAGWTGAAGGIYSTAGDLLTWDLALMTGKVVRPSSWQFLITPRRLTNGRNTGYSGGLDVGQRNGWMVLSHGGAVSGFVAGNAFVPGSRSAVVVLSSSENGAPAGAFNRAAAALLFRNPPPPGQAAALDSVPESEPPAPPEIQGPPAADAARALLTRLQQGRVDRATLAEEYSYFLSEEKVAGAAERLGPLGEPASVDVRFRTERGGMEVSVVDFRFAGLTVRALMYRAPNGRIEEFLLNPL